jgi:hypothetical protein
MKTSELTGAALDWAVAKCNDDMTADDHFLVNQMRRSSPAQYSTNWAQGGPIIEREKIDLRFDDEWIALKYGVDYDAPGMPDDYPHGPTPLIAAMRCYVASKLGDEVEIPDTLNH